MVVLIWFVVESLYSEWHLEHWELRNYQQCEITERTVLPLKYGELNLKS